MDQMKKIEGLYEQEFNYYPSEDKREDELDFFLRLNRAQVDYVRLNTGDNRLEKALKSIRNEAKRILNGQNRQLEDPDNDCPCVIAVRVLACSEDVYFIFKLHFYGVTSGDESPCTQALQNLLTMVGLDQLAEAALTETYYNKTFYLE